MHAYSELLKPSVVSHALFARLGSDSRPYLAVVRGGSLLQVFTDVASSRGPRWLAEFPLEGTVTGISSVDDRYLVLTIAPAKMVLLDWDAGALRFRTESMHYYEQFAQSSDFDGASATCNRVLSVDPHNCSVLFWFERGHAAHFTVNGASDPLTDAAVDRSAGERETQSKIINMPVLAASLDVSEVVDVAHCPIFRVPTLVVLCWTQPSWPGLSGSDGTRTKSIALVALLGDSTEPVMVLRDIPANIYRVVPFAPGTTGFALLIANDAFYILSETGMLSNVPYDDDERLENAVAVQLPHSPLILVVLENGKPLVINAITMAIESLSMRFSPEPTTITADEKLVMVGSRRGAAHVCEYSVGMRTAASDTNIDGSDLAEIYAKLVNLPVGGVTLQSLTPVADFTSYGPLSSITNIDNGLACATGQGVLIVERELPLIDVKDILLQFKLYPGKYWIVPRPSKPDDLMIMYTGFSAEPETEPSKKKRRTAKGDVDNQGTGFTKFCSLSAGDGEAIHIKEFAGSGKETISVGPGCKPGTLAIVQNTEISLYSSSSWRKQRSVTIPKASFGEVSNRYIVTTHDEPKEMRLYDAEDLSLIKTIPKQTHAAVFGTRLVTSSGTVLKLYDLETGVDHSYSLETLENVVEPIDTGHVGKHDAENGTKTTDTLKERAQGDNPNGTGEINDITASHDGGNADLGNEEARPQELVSLFGLQFDEDTEYIGVHRDRLFVLYEPVDNRLVKRYAVPFAVNQSPIWLGNIKFLVFPGTRSHALVKGRGAGFHCHLLHEKLADLVPIENGFAWIDDHHDTIYLSHIDTTIDYVSNKMPLRHIASPAESGQIKAIAYHEELAAIIVGVNEPIEFLWKPEEESTMNLDEAKAEREEDQGAIETPSDVPRPANGRAAHTFRGSVYVVPLATYEFQEKASVVLKADETILAVECVDHGELGDKQLLTLGTAVLNVEDEETNGYLRVYRLRQDKHGSSTSDDTAGHGNSAEVDSPPILIQDFDEIYLRGPVSSITGVMGFVAAGHGQQVHVFQLHKSLEPVGFFDSQVYMQDMKSIRNILILGERLRGPRLVNFCLEPFRLDLLSSTDPGQYTLNAVEGVSSGARQDLATVTVDDYARLQIFAYDPENAESAAGPRLVPLASFYTGHVCTAMTSAQLRASEDIVAYGSTADGLVFTVRPLGEDDFRTLFVLTQQMVDKEPTEASLNPRGHRATYASWRNHQHQIIDINYAQRFWSLATDRQVMYSRKLGFEGLSRVRRALNPEGRDLLKM